MKTHLYLHDSIIQQHPERIKQRIKVTVFFPKQTLLQQKAKVPFSKRGIPVSWPKQPQRGEPNWRSAQSIAQEPRPRSPVGSKKVAEASPPPHDSRTPQPPSCRTPSTSSSAYFSCLIHKPPHPQSNAPPTKELKCKTRKDPDAKTKQTSNITAADITNWTL